jgi:hypothetical protein
MQTILIDSTQIRWSSRKSDREAELHEWWPKASEGEPSGLSPLRSNGSHDGQAGRLDGNEVVVKDTQIYAKSQGGLPGLSPIRSDGFCGSQAGRPERINSGLRCLRKSRKMTLKSQGTYLKTGIVAA